MNEIRCFPADCQAAILVSINPERQNGGLTYSHGSVWNRELSLRIYILFEQCLTLLVKSGVFSYTCFIGDGLIRLWGLDRFDFSILRRKFAWLDDLTFWGDMVSDPRNLGVFDEHLVTSILQGTVNHVINWTNSRCTIGLQIIWCSHYGTCTS